MGFRFRRSIRIVPGVRINLGKKGASLSVGRRGANMTLGRNGIRTTVGIPGTGLSHTTLHRRPSGQIRVRPKRERKRPIILFSIVLLLLVLFAMTMP